MTKCPLTRFLQTVFFSYVHFYFFIISFQLVSGCIDNNIVYRSIYLIHINYSSENRIPVLFANWHNIFTFIIHFQLISASIQNNFVYRYISIYRFCISNSPENRITIGITNRHKTNLSCTKSERYDTGINPSEDANNSLLCRLLMEIASIVYYHWN